MQLDMLQRPGEFMSCHSCILLPKSKCCIFDLEATQDILSAAVYR